LKKKQRFYQQKTTFVGFILRLKTKTYIIEFNKLRFGLNELSFPIGDDLLAEMTNKPFDNVNATCNVTLIKKENIFEMQFNIVGYINTTCHTCLDDFELPLNKTYDLLVKLIDGPENLNDDEIIYLPKGLHEFDFKQFIYDYFLLAIPTKISCEDADKEHNQVFINKLNIDEGADDDDKPDSDPRWDALKNIYNKN
jgi:uncharacterized metal-binding protein YceD (DUF177 family)